MMKSSLKSSMRFLPGWVILFVSVNLSSVTFAATQVPATAAEFFSAPIQTSPPPQHTSVALNKIFKTGVGPFDPATMSGKVFPYNLPKNSKFGAPAYNGCYDQKNKRLGNLDPNLSCATTIAAYPNIPIYRFFIGYKIDCAEAPDASNNCNDTSLLFNCEYKLVNAGSAFYNPSSTTYYCSKGNPIIQRAKAKPVITPATIGCFPGTDGTTYPTCTKCADGYYNSATDPNKQACTKCSLSDIPTSSIQFAATLPQNFTTNTASSSQGAISASQCKITASDSWTCVKPGYVKTADNQACVQAPQCGLKLSTTSTNPTTAGGGSDGSITATYSGQTGSVTTFQITSPSTISPNSSGTFSNLSPNTYTVTVTDSACTNTANVTLSLITSPTPTPTPTPTATSTASPTPTSTATPIAGCTIDPNDPWLVRGDCTCGTGYRKSSSTNASGFYTCELIPVCDVTKETPGTGTPVMCTYNCTTDPYNYDSREMFLRSGETCSSGSALSRVSANTGCGTPVPAKCTTSRAPEYCDTDVTCPAGVKVLLQDFNYGVAAYVRKYGIPSNSINGVCVNRKNDIWISFVCGNTNSLGSVGEFNPPRTSNYPNGATQDSFQMCTNGYWGYTGSNPAGTGDPDCSR